MIADQVTPAPFAPWLSSGCCEWMMAIVREFNFACDRAAIPISGRSVRIPRDAARAALKEHVANIRKQSLSELRDSEAEHFDMIAESGHDFTLYGVTVVQDTELQLRGGCCDVRFCIPYP